MAFQNNTNRSNNNLQRKDDDENNKPSSTMNNEFNNAAAANRNVSNSTAWTFGNTTMDPAMINLPRNTDQSFVIVVFDDYESTYGKFRNSIMYARNIIKAYGHGEYFGQSRPNTIRCVDGYWSRHHSIGLLCFDSRRMAVHCMECTPNLREWCWLGGTEIYVTPACQPPKAAATFCFMQIDLYDVKHGTNFVRYLDQMVPLVADHNGLVVTGTQEIGVCKGVRYPNYIVMIQWTNPEDFYNFLTVGAPLLRDAGAACASRIFFEIEPPETQWW